MPHRVNTYRPVSLAPTNRHREYDRHARDQNAKAFYGSRAWKALRKVKLAADPLCEDCLEKGLLVPAAIADHIEPISVRPDLALAQENLGSKCWSCHSRRHAAEQSRERSNSSMSMHAASACTHGGWSAATIPAAQTAGGKSRFF